MRGPALPRARPTAAPKPAAAALRTPAPSRAAETRAKQARVREMIREIRDDSEVMLANATKLLARLGG